MEGLSCPPLIGSLSFFVLKFRFLSSGGFLLKMAVLCFLSSGGGFTFHREIVCPCLPVDKREWTHPFWKLDIPLEMFYKTKDPFTLLPHCIFLSIQPFDFSSSLLLSLWSIKETDIRAPIRWLFWGANLPSFQPSSSLIKVSSLPRHLVSWIHWPIMRRAERAWTW